MDSFKRLVPVVSALDLLQREVRRAERQHRQGKAMEGESTQEVISEDTTTNTINPEPRKKTDQKHDVTATLESMARLIGENTTVLRDVLARLREHQRTGQDELASAQPSSKKGPRSHSPRATNQQSPATMQYTHHDLINSFPSQKLSEQGTQGLSTQYRTVAYAPTPKRLLPHSMRAHTTSSSGLHRTKAAHRPSLTSLPTQKAIACAPKPSNVRSTPKLRYPSHEHRKYTRHDASATGIVQNIPASSLRHSQSCTPEASTIPSTASINPQRAQLPPQRVSAYSSSPKDFAGPTTSDLPPVGSLASENLTVSLLSTHEDNSLQKRHSIVTTEYPLTLPAIRHNPTSGSRGSVTLPSLQNLLIPSSPPQSPTPPPSKHSIPSVTKPLVSPVTNPRPQNHSASPWSLSPVHQDPQSVDKETSTLPTPQRYSPVMSQQLQVTDASSTVQRPAPVNKRPFRSSDSIIASQEVLPLASKRIRRSTSRAVTAEQVSAPTPKRLSRSAPHRTGAQRQPLDCIQVIHRGEAFVPATKRLRR
ncbi:hypothetical protein LZ30DRAFT_774603 [Colletotrichum cereale]|nr:hypothetical protein LZ30DRAFT_774603 [Colletotrichum cereale]